MDGRREDDIDVRDPPRLLLGPPPGPSPDTPGTPAGPRPNPPSMEEHLATMHEKLRHEVTKWGGDEVTVGGHRGVTMGGTLRGDKTARAARRGGDKLGRGDKIVGGGTELGEVTAMEGGDRNEGR